VVIEQHHCCRSAPASYQISAKLPLHFDAVAMLLLDCGAHALALTNSLLLIFNACWPLQSLQCLAAQEAQTNAPAPAAATADVAGASDTTAQGNGGVSTDATAGSTAAGSHSRYNS
jgi:hypothetical protein